MEYHDKINNSGNVVIMRQADHVGELAQQLQEKQEQVNQRKQQILEVRKAKARAVTERFEQNKKARDSSKVKQIKDMNLMIEANFYKLDNKEQDRILKGEGFMKQRPLSQDQVEQKIKDNLERFMAKKNKADMEKLKKPQLSLAKRQERAKLAREFIK